MSNIAAVLVEQAASYVASHQLDCGSVAGPFSRRPIGSVVESLLSLGKVGIDLSPAVL